MYFFFAFPGVRVCRVVVVVGGGGALTVAITGASHQLFVKRTIEEVFSFGRGGKPQEGKPSQSGKD